MTTAGIGAAGIGAAEVGIPGDGAPEVGLSRRPGRDEDGPRVVRRPSGRRVDHSREPDRQGREQVPDRQAADRQGREQVPGWGAVAVTMAHDLRAPLQALEVLAGQTLAGQTDPEQLAQRVLSVARRMRTTLASLSDVVDLGRPMPDPVEVDLGALVADVTADLAPLLAERGARIEAGALPTWPVDVVLFRRAMTNLVHNAVVHGAVPEPVVRVEGAVVRDCLCLEVVDNGQGLPGGAEAAESFFEPFARVGGDGVGLGLAICRGVAERHGGTITVPRSGPEGTTFRLVLPREPAPPAEVG